MPVARFHSRAGRKWTMEIREWTTTLTRFPIRFQDRMAQLQSQPCFHKTPDILVESASALQRDPVPVAGLKMF